MRPGSAVGLSVLAGACTLIGGLSAVVLRDHIKPKPFAASLSFSAGVMSLVSFVEIWFEGRADIEEGLHGKVGRPESMADLLSFLLFFAGWIIASCVNGVLHIAMQANERRTSKVLEPCLPPTNTTHGMDERRNECPDMKELCTTTAVEVDPIVVDDEKEYKPRSMWSVFVNSRFFRAVAGCEDVTAEEARYVEERFESEKTAIRRLGYTTALILALHNLPEGIATFTGGSVNNKVGIGLAIAIGVHNIPEGIAVAVPVYFGTGSIWKAIVYTGVSGMAEPVGALMAWALLGQNPSKLAFGIVFMITCGIMVNVALKELFVAAIRYDPGNQVTSLAFLFGMIIMAVSLIALSFTDL